jgi:hypothetical protein
MRMAETETGIAVLISRTTNWPDELWTVTISALAAEEKIAAASNKHNGKLRVFTSVFPYDMIGDIRQGWAI